MHIAVIGLGYVGLPLALGLARAFPGTMGFDINQEKVRQLQGGVDSTGETDAAALSGSTLRMTWEPDQLQACTVFIVAVPTPVDAWNRPDLTPIIRASETVGRILKPGDVVALESTVYPGVTEDVCGPVLARVSGLVQGRDFKLGYSPERINPGDREHALDRIVKVVAGEDAETLDLLCHIYGAVTQAGVHRAPSIKVAEAAKVLENTQRDINIALMNELALICDRMDLRTEDVLAAARTKWNFLPFKPGLVGGHCIGVDPYYLTTKAQELGYHSEVILAGRRINDGMGAFLGQKVVKLLIEADQHVKGARVGILGLPFKENVRDIRNSKVPDIVEELRHFGIEAEVHDPLADPEEVRHEYGITLCPWEQLQGLDALVLAVPHHDYLTMGVQALLSGLHPGGIVVDVKSVLNPREVPPGLRYWSL